MNILWGKGFNEEYNETDIGEISRPFLSFDSGLKIIKVIDTSGSNLDSYQDGKKKIILLDALFLILRNFTKVRK